MVTTHSLKIPVVLEKLSMGPKRKHHNIDDPYGGVLTLSNIENMPKDEQTARIKAVVNDIKATILFITQHANAENLTPDQTHLLYELFDDIAVAGHEERKRLKMDLEECERELEDCERALEAQEKQHEIHIEAVKEAARAELRRLCKENKRLSCRKTTAFQPLSEPRLGETCPMNGTKTDVENNEGMRKDEAGTLLENKSTRVYCVKSHLDDSGSAVDGTVEEDCPMQDRKESDSIVEDKPLEGTATNEQLAEDGIGDQADIGVAKDQGTEGKIKEAEQTDTETASG